jgi:hypothetical protein
MSFSTADQLSHKEQKGEHSQNTRLTHPSSIWLVFQKSCSPGPHRCNNPCWVWLTCWTAPCLPSLHGVNKPALNTWLLRISTKIIRPKMPQLNLVRGFCPSVSSQGFCHVLSRCTVDGQDQQPNYIQHLDHHPTLCITSSTRLKYLQNDVPPFLFPFLWIICPCVNHWKKRLIIHAQFRNYIFHYRNNQWSTYWTTQCSSWEYSTMKHNFWGSVRRLWDNKG